MMMTPIIIPMYSGGSGNLSITGAIVLSLVIIYLVNIAAFALAIKADAWSTKKWFLINLIGILFPLYWLIMIIYGTICFIKNTLEEYK